MAESFGCLEVPEVVELGVVVLPFLQIQGNRSSVEERLHALREKARLEVLEEVSEGRDRIELEEVPEQIERAEAEL